MCDPIHDPAPTQPGCRRTRIRFRVVGLGALLAMVTYLDRSCISVLTPDIMRDLALTKMQMSYVFSAFALAYAIFEIPTAWWADGIGTRRVLTRIVAWWSTFTIATATATNYGSLLLMRFLFGMGEAGAWPAAARTFSRWIPCRERGTVQGIFFSGAYFAGGLTPVLVIHIHGRQPDNGHSAGWTYWRQLLTSRNVLTLCLMYFPNSYVFYFCMTWLPTYLKEKHGLTEISLGVCAGLPLILSVSSGLLGGVLTDWAVARFGLRLGRSGLGCVAYTVAGAAAILAALATDPMAAAVLISAAVAVGNLAVPAAWATCIDIGGDHAAVVSAAMNTSGQIGSLLSPVMAIAMLTAFGDWNAPLYLIAILLFAGAVCWCFVDPRRRVFA